MSTDWVEPFVKQQHARRSWWERKVGVRASTLDREWDEFHVESERRFREEELPEIEREAMERMAAFDKWIRQVVRDELKGDKA